MKQIQSSVDRCHSSKVARAAFSSKYQYSIVVRVQYSQYAIVVRCKRCEVARNRLVHYISVCTKSINLRVNILCLKTQHIIHHWKGLIEQSRLVSNFRQIDDFTISYGPSKCEKRRFQKKVLAVGSFQYFSNFFAGKC